MQVTQEIKVSKKESFELSVAEILDCIEDKRLDGMDKLRENPEDYRKLQEIADAIECGKMQFKELKERFPSLLPSNAKQHQKNVKKLEQEARQIFNKLNISLVFDSEEI